MIKLAYSTPIARLDKIKIGDEVMDEYESTGRVIQITKNIKDKSTEFIFLLDSKQTIFIMCASA